MSFEMRLVAASLLSLLAAVTVLAQGRPTVVSAQTFLANNAAHAGNTEKLAVVAHIQIGYHINSHKPSLDYLIPTKVVFDDSASLKVARVVYPAGKLAKFAFLDSPLSVYEGEFRLGAILQISQFTKPGINALRGKLMYQACNDHACLPPSSVHLEATVRVVPSSVPLKPAHPEIFKTISFK